MGNIEPKNAAYHQDSRQRTSCFRDHVWSNMNRQRNLIRTRMEFAKRT